MASFKKYILPVVIFFGILVLYVHNLSRGSYGGDVGDLLAASMVMGVAHPPGYPLFTILGFLLSRISLVTPAFMIGLISAFSGALGVLLFYYFSLEITKSRIISTISAAILAFSYYYWFYSEIAEVFALNNLFVILLLFLAVLYSLKKDIKYLFLLSFFTGLSSTNHQIIIFIFPSLFILALPNLLKDFRKPKNIIFCLALGILGFSPYIYVPFAASHNPPVNWDNVRDFKSFLHLFLRQDYGTFNIGHVSAPTLNQRITSLKIYLFDILVQATLPVMFISFLGVLYSLKKYRKILLSLFLGFMLSGPVFIFYAGFPLYSSFNVGVYERFIIMSFVIALMFFPFGLLLLKDFFDSLLSKKELSLLIISVFFIVPLSLFGYNYPKTNLSTFKAGDNLAYDLLTSLPKNSVLLLSGDTVLFNTWYIHYGFGVRPDVEVMNLDGLTGSQYFSKARDKFLKENPKEINDINLSIKVVTQIAKSRPVFSILNIQPTTGNSITWIPYGLSSKLVLDKKIPTKAVYDKEAADLWETYHIPYKTENDLILGGLTASDIPLFYSNRLIVAGNFLVSQYSDKTDGVNYYKKALSVDNSNPAAYQVLGNYYVGQKQCQNAEQDFKQAITLDPFSPLSYFLLYYDYTNCFNNTGKAKEVAKQYGNTFKSDFYIDLAKTFNIKNK